MSYLDEDGVTWHPDYYESHITLDPAKVSRELVDAFAKLSGFKTSILVGDDVMGDARLLYCTGHGRDRGELENRMEKLANALPVRPMRMKIEHVVLDVRFV